MTFTEAALEVLRSAGEPLHYKKITELAIERNLLSHVGKTPEVTMSSRLAMMVKKDRGQAPIMKVKPGVFAIRESALQGQSLSPAALAAISEIEGLEESAAPVDGVAIEEVVVVKAPPLPGGDVFPEEEGDDDPILAGLEQEGEAGDRGGRRRRRRRRRGKGGDKVDGAPEVSVRPEPPREREPVRARESFREAPSDGGGRDRLRSERSDRNGRGERAQRSERNERGERERERERSHDDRGRSEDGALDWSRQPADGDLLGKDLADAVWMVLSRGDRAAHSFSRVAELLVRRGRLSGNPAALSPTIAAAVRADVSRAELNRARPRFRVTVGKVSLSEWQLPKALARAEQDLLAGADRYAAELRRALIQKLSELPTAGVAELLATWLNAEGVTALRAVRRPGSSGSELHFAGTRKSGSEEVRLAVVVQRSGRDIDREAVIDVRGALHHYGQAQCAWIVTTGRITSGAREEAGAQAAACALFDGNAMALAMERLGIAMRRHVIAHHEIDYDLLELLGDTPEQRERREREQDRERRQQSERSAERTQKELRSRGESLPPQAAERSERSDVLSESEHSDDADTLLPRKVRDADWDEDESHQLIDEVAEADEEGALDEAADSEVEDHDEPEDDDLPARDADDADDAEPFSDELEEGDEDEDDLDDEFDSSDSDAESADESEDEESGDESQAGESDEDEEDDESEADEKGEKGEKENTRDPRSRS